MELADIITEFGGYYQARGQSVARLYQLLRRKLASEDIFTTIITDDTLWEGSQVLFGSLVQAYQLGFTPIDPLGFKPIKIQSFHQKVDTKAAPHNLEATWLGFLADNKVSPKDWPFIRWWIETQLVPQIQEDMETKAIGKGVRVEPTTGVASNAQASMDGFLKIIAGHIISGRTVPISMGTIPTDPVECVQYFEDFSDQIDDKYWSAPLSLNVATAVTRRYKRGLRKVYGKDTVDNDLNLTIKETNLTIVGRDSMIGSNRIFCTPKENAVVLKKKTENQKRFDLQPVDREVKALTDWWYGVGFIIPELIFCNDQA